MSKHNKVNPGQYHVGGRLTPDEMARERMKQQRTASSASASPPASSTPRKKANASPPEEIHSAGNQGEDGHIRGDAPPSKTARARAAGRERG